MGIFKMFSSSSYDNTPSLKRGELPNVLVAPPPNPNPRNYEIMSKKKVVEYLILMAIMLCKELEKRDNSR